MVTDLDADMAYGGPAANCTMHSVEQGLIGNDVSILTTHRSECLDFREQGVSLYSAKAFRFFRAYPFAFQISFNFIFKAIREVRKSDLIHIHFARELVPVSTALICLLFRKPFVLQTHGMMEKRNLYKHKIWDSIFSNAIMKKANLILALQEIELKQLKGDFTVSPCLLGNGVSIKKMEQVLSKRELVNNFKNILFLARIHPRKQPELFLKTGLRVLEKRPGLGLEMYGAKSKASVDFFQYLDSTGMNDIYRGSVAHEVALEVISRSAILVLPSKQEPYPMSILESLCLGTPVLIMEDSGIAQLIQSIDKNFVMKSDGTSMADLIIEIVDAYQDYQKREELSYRAREIFDINKIALESLHYYESILSGDMRLG